MRGKLLVWLLISLVIWGAVGCASPAPADSCPVDEEETAVSLILLDASGAPLTRVTVRYRLDDGPWTALPEPVNGRAYIRGGGGVYQIEAAKAAYETATITVIVPAAEPPGCRVATQSAALRLAAAVCPVEPEALILQIVSSHEKERVRVTAVTPDGRRPALDCQSDAADCQIYQLPLAAAGAYQIALEGLPAIDNLFVAEGVIHYAWAAYEVDLTHGGQSVRLVGERANRLTLDVAVIPDEVGCAQPDLQTVVVSLEPDGDAPFPPLSGAHLGGLLMTDLSAEACLLPVEMKSVWYELTVPDGTPLDQVGLSYWLDGEWREGECGLENGRLLCAAQFPQPLIRQPYAVKALAAGEEYTIAQLPFDTLCILLR
jgi:hypothetical protein